MRKLGIAIVIVVVLIVVALLVVPSFINVNAYHDKIQAELQQKLGRSVSLGTMHLKLLPPKFRVDNVVIGEDPSFSSSRPFAQASELDVSVALLPLLASVTFESLTALTFAAVSVVEAACVTSPPIDFT